MSFNTALHSELILQSGYYLVISREIKGIYLGALLRKMTGLIEYQEVKGTISIALQVAVSGRTETVRPQWQLR